MIDKQTTGGPVGCGPVEGDPVGEGPVGGGPVGGGPVGAQYDKWTAAVPTPDPAEPQQHGTGRGSHADVLHCS